MVAVSFGMLCVLQVTLNISLRPDYNRGITKVTAERDQLQTSYNNLTKERDQIQKERDDLKRKFSNLKQTYPEGWQKFGSSWYFISTETKTWRESRQNCLKRGADLVIINSDKEQTLINRLKTVSHVWIGLTDSVTEGTWKWVDGTPLTTPRYWERGDPSGGVRENCVLFEHRSSGQGTWQDYPCSYNRCWICEI
ncbi:hypothetical protein J4Q44_G00039440 [Coregonus suidteri]|uniref:C-type lectin domain-containing protein n=1 Tax=Coregonus suidteri TaxID=861788 RepID=A0AAN8MD35_9TELE